MKQVGLGRTPTPCDKNPNMEQKAKPPKTRKSISAEERVKKRVDYGSHRIDLLNTQDEFLQDETFLRKYLEGFLEGGSRFSRTATEMKAKAYKSAQVLAFEKKWRVRVTLEVSDNTGNLVHLLIHDTVFPEQPARVDATNIDLFSRMMEQNPGRFVIVDSMLSKTENTTCLNKILPDEMKDKKKYPFELEPENIDEDRVLLGSKPTSTEEYQELFRKLYPSQQEKISNFENKRGFENQRHKDSVLKLQDDKQRMIRGWKERLIKLLELVAPQNTEPSEGKNTEEAFTLEELVNPDRVVDIVRNKKTKPKNTSKHREK